MSKRKPMRVNLTELAQITGRSVPTLKKLIAAHDDFPVASRGSNGVAYSFDARAVKAWLDQQTSLGQAEDAERRRQLELWRAELYGPPPPVEGPAVMTPAQRKAEAEAVRIEDYNRRQRAELLPRAPMAALIDASVVALRKELMQIPAEHCRARGHGREERLALEALIAARLERLADRLGDAEQLRGITASAA
ncbi:MAG TPA: hypothetical protein VLA52_07380 [Thermohalobaculum sp.]|nr:hypothetical protein [Thermohalobaculum sp.]